MADFTTGLSGGFSSVSGLSLTTLSQASSVDTSAHRTGVEILVQNRPPSSSTAPVHAKPLERSPSGLRLLSSRLSAFVQNQSVLTSHYAASIQAGGAFMDRVGKVASGFAANATSADASGALSGVGLLISAGLAIRTFVKDILPQRRQCAQLKQALSLLKNLKEHPEGVDLKKLGALLPKDVALPTQDTLDKTIRTIEERLDQTQTKLKTSSLKMSTQVLAATISGANFLSKVMHVAGIALKFLGVVSGVLIVAVGVISLVNHARALHGTCKQLTKLKNELSTCQDPTKQALLKEEIQKLQLLRRSQIFSVVMSSVEVILGSAFIVANALSGGAAIPVVMGLLAASSLVGVVGNYCFSRQMLAQQQIKPEVSLEAAPEMSPSSKPLSSDRGLMQPLLQRVTEELHELRG